MDNRRLKKYVQLIDQKRNLEDQVKGTKEELAVLEEYIIENMMTSGVQRTTMDGYTVYIHRQLWASGANGPEALHAALRDEGYPEMIEPKVNANRLSALVREYDADPKYPHDEEGLPILPGDLQSAVKISEQYKIKAKKAG